MSANLKNNQGRPLSISSITISGGTAAADYVAGGNCPLRPNTLDPGENCTIIVTFIPSALGIRTASLTVDGHHTTKSADRLPDGNGCGAGGPHSRQWAYWRCGGGQTRATPSGTLTNGTNVAVTFSGKASSEDFARGRPGTLPSRASGGPTVVPLSGVRQRQWTGFHYRDPGESFDCRGEHAAIYGHGDLQQREHAESDGLGRVGFLGAGCGHDQCGGPRERRLAGQHDDHRHLRDVYPVRSDDGSDTGHPDYQPPADEPD